MRRASGFTLIELMITMAIVAILTAIALPSYQRGGDAGHDMAGDAGRAAGQQFLTDLAQREEQYFVDARSYATGLGVGAGQMNITIPDQVSSKYQNPVFTVNNAAVPPTFTITIAPIAGTSVATDGTLVINSLAQRWREVDNNGVFGNNDCIWEKPTCVPS